ncbi:MAG TPA: ThuA domain-containing protein [Fimbriimonas sp.]|nr:ThuA domain-containing protein [Fimbriimonas sp.]
MLTLLAAMTIAPMNVLVYSKTAGFRHDSIETGQQMFRELAADHGFTVTTSEDPSQFSPYNLRKFNVVVFLNTTGDCLGAGQQKAFEEFINRGGGFVGIHSAADTEYDWPFYGSLVSAYFLSHPQIQEADVRNEQPGHPTMKFWPEKFRRKDEWYDYRANPRPNVTVLASLDTTSYQGSKMAGDHPITWCHDMGEGRAFYTGFGHTKETYAELPFRNMVYAALEWVCKR